MLFKAKILLVRCVIFNASLSERGGKANTLNYYLLVYNFAYNRCICRFSVYSYSFWYY